MFRPADCDGNHLSDRTGAVKGTTLASGGRSTSPGWKPYVWHDPDAERHAEVQATVARIRAQAARSNAGEVTG